MLVRLVGDLEGLFDVVAVDPRHCPWCELVGTYLGYRDERSHERFHIDEFRTD